MLSFSLSTNFKAICDQAVGSDTIPCIHGIRALSMAWIILGHTCIISFKYSDNMELRKVVEQSFFFQTISNGAFSVDTFFFISGFLVSFIYFRYALSHEAKKLWKNALIDREGFFVGNLSHQLSLLLSFVNAEQMPKENSTSCRKTSMNSHRAAFISSASSHIAMLVSPFHICTSWASSKSQ